MTAVWNIKSDALYTLLFKLDSILLLLNDISPSIPTLNAVIVFIFIGLVDVVPLNDINTSVSFLNPKKITSFESVNIKCVIGWCLWCKSCKCNFIFNVVVGTG